MKNILLKFYKFSSQRNLFRFVLIIAGLTFFNNVKAQMTPFQAVEKMTCGINIGQSMELEYEPARKIQSYYFSDFKAAGFDFVRIPVRWDKHTGATAPYTVDAAWLDRVEQVVDWSLSQGLITIINSHHDRWILANNNPSANDIARFKAIWTQIANRFKNKSEKLLFEIANEPAIAVNLCDNLNSYIIPIIRQTNPTRNIVFGSSGTQMSTLKQAVIPNDPYLIASFHSYIPWPFSGEGIGTWGSTAEITQIEGIMAEAAAWSEAHNIPMLLGEYSARVECEVNARAKWFTVHTEKARRLNIAPCVWMDFGWFTLYYDTQVEANKWTTQSKNAIVAKYHEPAEALTVSNNQLTWNNRDADYQSITIERKVGSGSYQTIATLTGSAETFLDGTAVAGTTYTYRVVSKLSTGALAYSFPSKSGVTTLPIATISSPVNNSTFTPGSTITVTGTASTQTGTISNVKVYDDATLLGTATGTTNWTYSWTNVPAGSHNIKAVATNSSGVTGTSPVVTINDNSHINLALNKTVTVSSTESATFSGSAAVDGNSTTTRWASLFADPQWISIDLLAKYDISQVKLFWEAASAKAYQIQVSNDNVTWTSIYSTTTSTGGNQTLDITGTGRYIRMYGTARNTAYGYSLFEFEVYGTLAADIAVTGITVTPATASINVAATAQLTATVAPANATNKNFTWSTSNAAVATVSATGLVSGLTAGTATITATTQDGGFTSSSVVTVRNIAVTGITVTPATASINVAATAQLTATVAPANATIKNYTWSTSNAAVATVSATGLVTGVTAGTAIITATTQDGGLTSSCAVTVNAVLVNIAKNKPVTVSSTESATYPGTYAVDGSATTRWASAFADPQWISVNLQASYDISQVKLNWEAASAKAFQIQVSNDNVNWVTIYSTTTSAGGIQTLNVNGTGSYIRIYGTVRNTAYGYSIFEFEVYGSPAAPTPVSGVTVTPATATINMAATVQLTATVAPANATNKNVTWSTSNAAVATVSATGLVSGISAGTATITATTQDGGFTSACTVTVLTAPTDPLLLSYFLFVDKWTADYMRTTDAASVITQLESATVPTSTLCQWEFRAATTNGYYYILNRSTGKAIFPTGASVADNVGLSQVALTTSNQNNTELQWAITTSDEANYYWIKNRKSGLNIRPNAGTNGTGISIVQNTLNTTYSSFKWNLVSQGLKSAFIGSDAMEVSNNKLTIYPNPVSDELHIQNAVQNSTVEVYDLSGRLVLAKKLPTDNNILNVKDLNAGMYILKATGNDKTRLIKFIKK